MPLNLYLSEIRDPDKALVSSAAAPNPIPMKELVFGESHVTNIYIVDGAGAYSAAGGAVGSTVKVGIGTRGGVPTEGTFTLTFDGETTSELAYNSTAAQIESALEALPSIGEDNVDVTGEFPSWQVEFIGDLAEAAQDLIVGDRDLLFPVSVVNVSRIQAGDTGANEVQYLNLSTETAWLSSSWTRFAGPPAGWTGLLSPNGLKVFQLFNGKSSISPTLEIRVTDASGNPRSYASIPFKLLQTLIPTTSLSTTLETSVDGVFAIPNGVDQVTIEDLGLTLVPRRIALVMIKPAGGLNIFPSLVDGSESTDGFTVDLSGMTDNSNYKLGYILLF